MSAQRDYQYMLRLSDARKAEIARARERAQSDQELCALLLSDAKRRGQAAIDWPEYFRNVGLT
jgi:hypothetical protein